jgi:hypothetical protein
MDVRVCCEAAGHAAILILGMLQWKGVHAGMDKREDDNKP